MIAFLDTCVVIDALREDKPHYRKRVQEAAETDDGIIVSSFVLHELVFGAMISSRPQVELTLVDRFVERARVEPWTAEDAIAAARIRADPKATGSPVGAVECLIAGQAMNRGWPIVTSNIKDFIRIPGLILIDWSDPAGAKQFDHTAWRPALSRRPEEDL